MSHLTESPKTGFLAGLQLQLGCGAQPPRPEPQFPPEVQSCVKRPRLPFTPVCRPDALSLPAGVVPPPASRSSTPGACQPLPALGFMPLRVPLALPGALLRTDSPGPSASVQMTASRAPSPRPPSFSQGTCQCFGSHFSFACFPLSLSPALRLFKTGSRVLGTAAAWAWAEAPDGRCARGADHPPPSQRACSQEGLGALDGCVDNAKSEIVKKKSRWGQGVV